MQKVERDLLEVLKFELQFLEDGGYGRSPRTPWRPQYIFEDSLTCVNYDSKENRGPCSDCVLMPLVPLEHRSEKIPCRHIPFNTSGENLDSLYRYGNQRETEETVGVWLRVTIQRLEEERAAARQAHSKQPPSGGGTVSGAPLYQKQHPKCANPACATAFHWTGGGKFFRFRPDPVPTNGINPSVDSPGGIHGVRHYWLCERCSHVFTLVYDEEYGVTLKLIWSETRGRRNSQGVVSGVVGPALSNWLEPCEPALPVRFGYVFESRERCKMQEDERDLLEVLIFDEIEETVGTWLRTIIRRLEKEQRAIRRDQQKQPTSGYETLRGTPLNQKHHPKTGEPRTG